jgi:SAM-dependent methyltransferase
VEARVAAIEDLRTLQAEPYDGLISAFASLSSVPDLVLFAREAARLVRPGGSVIVHMLNRFSAWEWLGHVRRGEWSSARRVASLDTRVFIIGGQPVSHWLYSASEVAEQFRPWFAARDAFSLGALRPPHTVRRIPAPVVAALEWLDVRVGRLPLLKDAGRFFVLELERLA